MVISRHSGFEIIEPGDLVKYVTDYTSTKGTDPTKTVRVSVNDTTGKLNGGDGTDNAENDFVQFKDVNDNIVYSSGASIILVDTWLPGIRVGGYTTEEVIGLFSLIDSSLTTWPLIEIWLRANINSPGLSFEFFAGGSAATPTDFANIFPAGKINFANSSEDSFFRNNGYRIICQADGIYSQLNTCTPRFTITFNSDGSADIFLNQVTTGLGAESVDPMPDGNPTPGFDSKYLNFKGKSFGFRMKIANHFGKASTPVAPAQDYRWVSFEMDTADIDAGNKNWILTNMPTTNIIGFTAGV